MRLRRAWALRLTLFRQSRENWKATILPRVALAIAAAAVFLTLAMSRSLSTSLRGAASAQNELILRKTSADGKLNLPIPLGDYRHLRSQLTAFRCLTSGAMTRFVTVRAGSAPIKAELHAVEPDYFTIAALRIRQGAFLPNGIVITEGSARRLFGPSAGLGDTIHVDGVPFLVSAIVDDPGADTSSVIQLFVPLDSTPGTAIDPTLITSVYVLAPDLGTSRAVGSLVSGLARSEGLLAANEMLVVERPSARAAADEQVRRGLRVASTVVAVITLIGGMAGFIASVLLMIRERLHEIALRRAIGATRARLLAELTAGTFQFASVSVLAGVLAGFIAEIVICRLRGWPVSAPLGLAVADAAFCIACTLLAATIPALRAASLDPAAALRGEWLIVRSSSRRTRRSPHRQAEARLGVP